MLFTCKYRFEFYPYPKAMDRDTKFKQSTLRYDYHSCYKWCVNPENKMDKPSEKKEHRGIFGADGDYHWRAYAESEDGNGHPVIPKDRSFQALPGSNELYCFRAVSALKPAEVRSRCALVYISQLTVLSPAWAEC